MLCEIEWDKQVYVGVIQHTETPHTYSPEELKGTTTTTKYSFLCKTFGESGIVKGKSWNGEQKQFEEEFEQQELVRACIWYPCSFLAPGDTYEQILLQKSPVLKMFGGPQFLERIHWSLIDHNLKTTGYEVFRADSLLKNFHLELTKECKYLYDKVLTLATQTPDREVAQRQIFYLNEKNHISAKDVETSLQLHKIYPLLEKYFEKKQFELWNAFLCVVPANKMVPAQMVHRDTCYESLSVFFYLRSPCDPQTGFFSFTHRLVMGIKQGIGSQAEKPRLEVGDILLMNGQLFHYGLESTQPYPVPRILFIFQYRTVVSRLERSRMVHRFKRITTEYPDYFPTIFNE
jgi:hypothetical protein